jgi:HEXXH motif-containing protein
VSLSKVVGWGRPLQIELLGDVMGARYGPLGIRSPTDPFDLVEFEAALRAAFAQLQRVPPVASAVEALVWSVTPICVEGPDFDTSYSDPAVALSIFIGAHPAANRPSSLRVAEGVLHETMHLQLSLIEDVVPLFKSQSEWLRSPWQDRLRPTQGLLHGLYVFRVIQDFFRAAIETGRFNGPDSVHARARIVEIDEQCAELVTMRGSVDLTADGIRFLESMLR